MEEVRRETKYKRGKNPNSLANLQRGHDRKGDATKRTYKTMREMALEIMHEEDAYKIIGKEGKEETIIRTKLEAMLRAFIRDCVKSPSPQKIEEMRKMIGEDMMTINVRNTPTDRFAEVELPREEKIRLAMMIMEKTTTR